MNELNKVPALANETIIREKLEKYIMAMKNTTSG
jgi:hypothetical protein